MAPDKKKARRPKAVRPATVGGDDQNLLLMIGEMRGALNAHIEASAEERDVSANYRKEVREQLSDLKTSVAEVAPLKKRVDRIEPIVDANARQIFVASTIIGGAFLLIGSAIKMFGADLKAWIFRAFRIS